MNHTVHTHNYNYLFFRTAKISQINDVHPLHAFEGLLLSLLHPADLEMMMAILISAPQDTQQHMSVHEFAHPIAVRSINTPETDYNVLAVCSQNHSHVNHVGLFLLLHIAPFRAGGNIHQGCITGVNGGVGSSDTCFSHTWYSFRRGKKAKLVA